MKRINFINALIIAFCFTTCNAFGQISMIVDESGQPFFFEEVITGDCKFKVPLNYKIILDYTILPAFCNRIYDNDTIPNYFYAMIYYRTYYSSDLLPEMSKGLISSYGRDISYGNAGMTRINGLDAYAIEINDLYSDKLKDRFKGYIYSFYANAQTYFFILLHKHDKPDRTSEIIKTLTIEAPQTDSRTHLEALNQEFIFPLKAVLPLRIDEGSTLYDTYVLDNLFIIMRFEDIDINNLSAVQLSTTQNEIKNNLLSSAIYFVNFTSSIGNYIADDHGMTLKVIDKNDKPVVESSFTSEQLLGN